MKRYLNADLLRDQDLNKTLYCAGVTEEPKKSNVSAVGDTYESSLQNLTICFEFGLKGTV